MKDKKYIPIFPLEQRYLFYQKTTGFYMTCNTGLESVNLYDTGRAKTRSSCSQVF